MDWSTEGNYKSEKEFGVMEKQKINEIQEGSVVLEVYEKTDENTGRRFFDIRCSKEYIVRNTREKKRGPYLHNRDLDDLVIASMYAQKYITNRIKSLRYESNTED